MQNESKVKLEQEQRGFRINTEAQRRWEIISSIAGSFVAQSVTRWHGY